MKRIFKIIGIIITICFLKSCSYNFLVKKENTLYKQTGFIISTYHNNFFIPYNLKEPINDSIQKYFSKKYLRSNSYAIGSQGKLLSEELNIYGTSFNVKNNNKRWLEIEDGYYNPNGDTIYRFIPVEISYFISTFQSIKKESFIETFEYNGENIRFKYTGIDIYCISIFSYFSDSIRYSMEKKYFNESNEKR